MSNGPRAPPPIHSWLLSKLQTITSLWVTTAHSLRIKGTPAFFLYCTTSLSLSPSLSRCAICMMDYCAGELIKLLPCMHFYHLRCIDDWLMRSLTCPSCMERVDSGLLATLSSGGNHVSPGGRGSSSRGGGGGSGRGLGFSLRRRRRGQQPSESESRLVSGGAGSGSSSRSSSTSSSREHLTSGGPISWPGQQSPRRVVRSGSGTIFLPPFPSATSPTSPCGSSSQSFTDLGPPPQISSPPSSPGVFLPHISPPHSPQFPHVTIHTTPSCSPPPSHQTQVSTN